jgi:homoserine kinase
MGMALRIHNEIQVRLEGTDQPSVHVAGQGEDSLPRDESNLVYQAYSRLLEAAGMSLPTPVIRCRNEIPLERGLGSSAAAIVGGLTAANHLAGNPLTSEEILSLAVDLEGHPDNVAPALLGGIRIVAPGTESIVTAPVPLPPDLRVALFIPEGSISTVEARSVMPADVPMEDALFNVGRTALLVNAFATGRLEDLKAATEDRLHQPYRSHLLPAMRLIIGEAMKGGALGAFVSGSGSTVLAICRGREMSVAYEMAEMARKTNVPGRAIITFPSETGACVVEGSG